MEPTVYDGTTKSDTQLRKNDNNGKGWYSRFDEDNKVSYNGTPHRLRTNKIQLTQKPSEL